ncbi:unnamed protein product [Leptosia nina]|uniref:Uncharacterized protein n=1 Tax=Leptosia nina TaxID=320188 RepID=A0AAV1JBK7_9NEOP
MTGPAQNEQNNANVEKIPLPLSPQNAVSSNNSNVSIQEKDGSIQEVEENPGNNNCTQYAKRHTPYHKEYYMCDVCFQYDGELGVVLLRYVHDVHVHAPVCDVISSLKKMNPDKLQRAEGCALMFQRWPFLIQIFGSVAKTFNEIALQALYNKMDDQNDTGKDLESEKLDLQDIFTWQKRNTDMSLKKIIGLCVRNAVPNNNIN